MIFLKTENNRKKERAKKLAEKMTPNFSFVETREKVDENEKQSTNIDSVPNDLGVLSEREALKHEVAKVYN